MQKEVLQNAVKATFLALVFSFSPTIVYTQPNIVYSPLISSGLSQPMEVTSAPGDPFPRLFIVEKAGVIKVWNGSVLLPTPFLNIQSLVSSGGERGLLSMAFHPQYQSNGFFFVYYTDIITGHIKVARYQVSSNPNVAIPTANPVAALITIPKIYDNHNGGHLQFKVESGINYLYFATGDGGSGNDPDNNSQNPNSFLGKMIRMNVDAATPVPEVWAWGLRNPFRWSFDRATGDMWIGDVGQGLKEEVNFRQNGTSGANYGWPCFEANITNAGPPAALDCDSVGDVDILPVFSYDNPPSGSSSVVGGYVYRGTEYPSLQGYYITADFYSGLTWLISPNGSSWTVSAPYNLDPFIASFSETSDGSTIYAVSLAANTVYKVVVPFPLPLTLIHFSGRGGQGYNDLRWTAEAEENINKYIIEYSTDGRNYSSAGEVLSLNNANRNNYSFRHHFNIPGKIFYRLRIAEMDGSYEYSPVIAIGGDKTPITVYPTTVTTGQVNIISGNPVDQINLINASGQQVLSKNMNGVDGYFTLSIPSLPKGMYFVQLAGKGFRETKKILVQ